MKYILLLILTLSITSLNATNNSDEQIDDWDYNTTAPQMDKKKRLMPIMGNIKTNHQVAVPVAPTVVPSPVIMSAPMVAGYRAKNIGLSVGGAKDTNNFKANIDNNYLPKLESITYEGQFYNHYFETGIGQGECKALFCPSYSSAKRLNSFSNEEEYFLSVGLNSGIKEGDFKRKKLNLMVVLDISGSMGGAFNSYYYDKVGNKIETKEESRKNKMQIANEAIVSMLSHLNDDDRIGVALFDNDGYKAKGLGFYGKTDKEALSKHILAIKSRGGTNWSAGYRLGLELFDEVNLNASEYENRIIFLTDAMPNSGELSKNRLFGMAKDASQKGISTTFVGIGVDFNNDLVEYVSKTKGANYFSVHSSKEFSKLLDKEFDYMVTPLVYDLELKLSSANYSIEAVYGSPDAKRATGQLMKVNTLFPSHNDGTATKGGVILIKLKKNKKALQDEALTLDVAYTDVNGTAFSNSQKVSFKEDKVYYDNSGIRKAILVADYVSVMKNWLIDSRAACNDDVRWATEQPLEIQKRAMIYPPMHPAYPRVATWEKKSCALNVSEGYKKLFQLFKKEYKKEASLLKDDSLDKELTILNQLLKVKSKKVSEDKKISIYGEEENDEWMYNY